MDSKLPTHVAIVPDGNRRYAERYGMSRFEGHQAGANRMHGVVESAIQHGIKYLTVWGFSCDNWKRSPEEVRDIFQLLQLWIEKDTPWLHENGVRLKHIGRLHELPDTLQDVIVMGIDITRGNKGMTLNLAFNYSGRADILNAVNRLIANGIPFRKGNIPDVTEELFSHCLYTDGMPDVDLVIRTAGEFRLSNFMLWQVAYSEFYFSDKLWPDFDKPELEKALEAYQASDRRFGGD